MLRKSLLNFDFSVYSYSLNDRSEIIILKVNKFKRLDLRMSLNFIEKRNTIKELAANREIAGLTFEEIANDLQTNAAVIEQIFSLQTNVIENPWVLKEYLADKIQAAGKVAIDYTALVGDYHEYWFLNSQYIDQQKITRN